MRYLFAFLLLAHGLIHLMGFVKAFKFAEISQLSQPISRPTGAMWLLAALLFVVATVMLFLQKDTWWMVAAPAVVLSQCLIFRSWQDAKFGTIANGIALLAIIIAYGTWSYFNTYRSEVKAGLEQPASLPAVLLTEADLQGLPEPVRKYLHYTGALGKPKINNFKMAGSVSNIKIPLYIHSRFRDLEAYRAKNPEESQEKKTEGWIVTNTRFSDDAMDYGQCAGMHLVGWNYPAKGSLRELVDDSNLHPVTCLTLLTRQEKNRLLEQSIILAKTLCKPGRWSDLLHLSGERREKIMSEARTLCGELRG